MYNHGFMTERLNDTAEWSALAAHQRALASTHLHALFAEDPQRFERFSLRLDGMLADFSRHFLTRETLMLLMALAQARDVSAWIERLFTGEPVNNTEQRAALHTALRSAQPVLLNGTDVAAEARAELARMAGFVETTRSTRQITDVVNIGIGGSYLGPQLACAALRPYTDGQIRAHFVSNVDGENLAAVLPGLKPASTLFLVTSKTFTTQETMANAQAAQTWMTQHLGAAANDHFVAVTAEPVKARAWGIAEARVFRMFDWVGGRYSLWSAVGLPVALVAGMPQFHALLGGARAMDEHFRAAPLARNLPVLLALLDVWYSNFWGAQTRAVIPYAHALSRLPAYLQQLEMESLGKRVTREGEPVAYNTGNIVWGEPGSDAQHSFFQLLHQGTRLIPTDFIAACRVPAASGTSHDQHQLLLSNFIAQGRALMQGTPADLAPHAVAPGNRPSTSLLFDELNAHALGQLIALYEHKVFVQSVIWDINAFDQWGVTLGKEIATELLPALRASAPVKTADASTNGLIDYYKAHKARN